MTKETRDRLAAIELLEIELLKAQRGKKSLREFIDWLAPHEPPPPHLQKLIELIELARRKKIRVCISMPPRHGKTVTIQRGIAWWIWSTGRDTCAYVSYSEKQAHSKSDIARLLAQAAGVRIPRRDTQGEWRTDRGGGLLSAGAGAGLTGQGVQGLMVVDDPYKNREEAESHATREKIWDNFCDVVFTRDEGHSVIVCHTRWVEDDLIGRLVREHGWPLLNLPAVAERDDILGREPGEALWPQEHSLEQLREVESINAHTFASLYQGRPRPRGTSVFGPETYYDQANFSMDGWRLVLYADPAASESTSADYSVYLLMAMRGYGMETQARVIDVYRRQVAVPEFARALRTKQLALGNVKACIEAVAGFKAVPQMLRDIDKSLRVKGINPLGDKFTRSQPAATAWNDPRGGRIQVPLPTPDRPVHWLKEFLYEVSIFTGTSKDPHDDQVDCLSGAWNEGYMPVPPDATDYGPMQPRRM